MTRYDVCVAIAYIISFIAIRNKRAKNWLIIGAVSYVVSMAYQFSGLKFYRIFAGTCDSFVCILINFYGKYLWEKILWQLWKISVLVSILSVYGIIYNEFYYKLLIECVNWGLIGWVSGIIFFEKGYFPRRGKGIEVPFLTRAREIYEQKACFPHWWID